MSEPKLKDSEFLQMKLREDIKHLLDDEKLDYEDDATLKLARYSLDFVIHILNDADDLKNCEVIQKENIALAIALETENRLAIYQPLPYKELIDISVVYNSKELPEIKTCYGLRIPPDNLTKINYKLKNRIKEVPTHIRKATLQYNHLPNHLKYMNPFMPNPMQMSIPMCVSPKPVLNPMASSLQQTSLYATLYAAQQSQVVLQQHIQHPYMPTTPQVPQQCMQSPMQSQISYKQDMQMTPQRLVFRPRFNIVPEKDNNANCNKRKAL